MEAAGPGGPWGAGVGAEALLLAGALCPAAARGEVHVYVLQEVFPRWLLAVDAKGPPLAAFTHVIKSSGVLVVVFGSSLFPQPYSIIVSLEPAAQDPNL